MVTGEKYSLCMLQSNERMVKQILKYNLTKNYHTWNRSCLDLSRNSANRPLTSLIFKKTNNVRMSICTVREINWSICVKIYAAITKKHFFSERCTSTSSKNETVTRDSKIFKSGMLRKFGQLFKNVPHVTVTVKGKWEPFF